MNLLLYLVSNNDFKIECERKVWMIFRKGILVVEDIQEVETIAVPNTHVQRSVSAVGMVQLESCAFAQCFYSDFGRREGNIKLKSNYLKKKDHEKHEKQKQFVLYKWSKYLGIW